MGRTRSLISTGGVAGSEGRRGVEVGVQVVQQNHRAAAKRPGRLRPSAPIGGIAGRSGGPPGAEHVALRGFLERRDDVGELLVGVVDLQDAEAQRARRLVGQRGLALAPVDQKGAALRGVVDPVVVFVPFSRRFYPPKTGSPARTHEASS